MSDCKRFESTIEAYVAGERSESLSPDWDYDHGTPRKYLRRSGSVHGGDITVKEGC